MYIYIHTENMEREGERERESFQHQGLDIWNRVLVYMTASWGRLGGSLDLVRKRVSTQLEATSNSNCRRYTRILFLVLATSMSGFVFLDRHKPSNTPS